MLHKRELIPPLTVRDLCGNIVQAWDFKQRRNLVIAFLDAGCARCEAFASTLIDHAGALREKTTSTLLVSAKRPELSPDTLPEGIVAGWDASGAGIRSFLGEDAQSGDELRRGGVFVTDRYGEIVGLWISQPHDFPRIEEILSTLTQAEIACEECTVPTWPVSD